MRKIYTSIDIGSDTVKFVVGEEKDDKVYVLASHAIKSKGIRKGLIVDSNLAVNTIKDGIKIINEDLGIEIKKVLVNVPDYNAKFKDQVLPEAKVESSVDTKVIGIGISSPENIKEIQKNESLEMEKRKNGNDNNSKIVLPKYRNAVKNYFSN